MASTAISRIDGVSTSVAVKAPVHAVATTNVVLSGLQTVGGVVLDGSTLYRVLLTGQTDTTQNGIYDASTGSWVRSADFDGAGDVVTGTLIPAPGASPVVYYQVTTSNPIVPGTTAISFQSTSGLDTLRADLASGTAGLVGSSSLKFNQTTAESTASVTPANTAIPSNDVIGTALNSRFSALSDALKVVSRALFFSSTVTPSAKLTLQDNGYGLVGDGQYTSILAAPNLLNDYVFDTNSKSAFLLQDFKITGNSSGNTSSKGLNVNNSYYCRITGVDVRDCNSDAITYTNSNSIVATNTQVHSTSGNGWVIDATSQKNVFNGCGAEDWSGYGFKISGIANILNAPWIENRSSATAATDIGILVNNRDNIINCPELRGAVSFALGTGIQLGASSTGCIVNNPHFSNCTINIETLGTNLYRSIIGATDADVTNTGGDTTTYIRKGNVVYSNQSWISTAPVLTFQSTNTTSGVVFNLTGTASSAHYRWQVGGTTKWQMTSADNFTPGTDNTLFIGAAANRVAGVFATKILTTTASTVFITSGSGSPEGSVTASVGSLYTRTDGGASTTLYVKESGTGNTGWIAK